MFTNLFCRILALFSLLGLFSWNAFGANSQSIYFPANAALNEEPSNSNAPFWRGLNTTGRMQIVYGSTVFDNLFGIHELQQIRFRPNADLGPQNPFSVVIPNITVRLSTTQKSPDHLSTSFQENAGPDEVVVFSGNLPMFSNVQGPAGGPKEFDAALNLTTPFYYDASKGNLLLDVIYPSGSGPQFQMDGVFASDDQVSLMLQDTFASASLAAPIPSTNGPVTQFVFVPEPSTIYLLVVAILSLVAHAAVSERGTDLATKSVRNC